MPVSYDHRESEKRKVKLIKGERIRQKEGGGNGLLTKAVP
jgi:hypothetical protein